MSFECQGFESELSFRRGNTTLKVMPERCLISGFQVNDWDVLYRPVKTKNLMRAGLPLMIPNFSSLEGDKTFLETGTKLPHHGFGRVKVWTVEKPREDGVSCFIQDDEETFKIYPFHFKFTMNVTNLGDGRLRHEVIMENRSKDKSLPVQPGLHPYFTCPHDCKSQIKTTLSGFDASEWDWQTKETTPDYNVEFPKEASIEIPTLGSIEFKEEPQEQGVYQYRRCQIWSEPASSPDRDFVCIEPCIWGANGLNDPTTRINIPPTSTVKIVMIITAVPKQ